MTCPTGQITIKLAKEFGLLRRRALHRPCLRRAQVFPDKPLYILGEIIHNPEVNDQIREMGIHFLSASSVGGYR